jgi:hypothetical protein
MRLVGTYTSFIIGNNYVIAFYLTTFDELTMVISSYSYKKLEVGK